MADPLVTIVLPAYKMGPYIGEALLSIAAQTGSRWEVIVVDDNGPEDGTARVVREFADTVKQRVEYIRHGVNQGVSGARNTGIRAGSGEFVAFLDPDDTWLPHHLESALSALTAGADVACAPVLSYRNEPGRSWTHEAWFEPWKKDHFPLSLAVYNFILPSAVVARRSHVLDAGCFDTAPDLQHIEDYDLWIRLVEAGSRFVFLDRIGARYRKHGGGATAQEAKFVALHERLYQKHPVFFREGQRRMLRVALDTQHRTRAADSGPLRSCIRWIDGIFRRIGAKLSSSK